MNRVAGLVARGRAAVCVVDDDPSVRESLPDLLAELGFASHVFDSAVAFLSSARAESAECLILDLAMPGISGPELQAELKRRGNPVPVIFITADTELDLSTWLLEQGAVACLPKPFSESALLGALDAAIGPR